jgi:hypothetical protein
LFMAMAAANPAGPPPMIKTSVDSRVFSISKISAF